MAGDKHQDEDLKFLQNRLFDACNKDDPAMLLSVIEEGNEYMKSKIQNTPLDQLLAAEESNKAMIEEEVLACREHKISISCLRNGEKDGKDEDEIDDEIDTKIGDMSQDVSDADILDRIAEKKMTRFLDQARDGSGMFLLHKAASGGKYFPLRELYDLFDGIECDPRINMSLNRAKTPLHLAIDWVRAESEKAPRGEQRAAKRENCNKVVELMLSYSPDSVDVIDQDKRAPKLRQGVEKDNQALLDMIDEHEERIRQQNEKDAPPQKQTTSFFDDAPPGGGGDGDDDDDEDIPSDAEYSGDDDEERAEFMRRKAAKKGR